MGRGTGGEVGTIRWSLGEVQDGSGDPRGDPGWVGGSPGRSETGRGPLGEVREGWGSHGVVWNGSLDPQGGLGLV